jgi:hypothetical protein
MFTFNWGVFWAVLAAMALAPLAQHAVLKILGRLGF